VDTPQDEALACPQCGQVHKDARWVDLPDGRRLSSYSEELRRYHEAVWVLRKKRSKRTRLEYLDAVAEKRGIEARIALREEMMRIWQSRQG
jgi:NMD protein affecting ribosome stability and mRNA decay